MDNKLRQVCNIFHAQGTYLSYEEITIGHINRTYKINFAGEDGSIHAYVAQSLNMVAFKDPVSVMENIDRVTRHIQSKRPNSATLQFARTDEGKPYHFEGEVFWRLYNYIPSVSYDTCDDLNIVSCAGAAFGEFQTMLSDLDPTLLHTTIPDFHNTRQRYRNLEASIEADTEGLVSSVAEDLAWLRSVREEACLLTDLADRGELPLRIAHNDTKINNVLFEKDCSNALVIDLDTVMPGLVGYDFGDAIRYTGNCAREDCSDLGCVGLNMDVFRAFAQGFLSRTAGMLTSAEVDTLARSCFVLTTEQAVRFLDDYISGSHYFKVDYPEHNLVRARCQIALAKDILTHMDEMEEIIRLCAAEYR